MLGQFGGEEPGSQWAEVHADAREHLREPVRDAGVGLVVEQESRVAKAPREADARERTNGGARSIWQSSGAIASMREVSSVPACPSSSGISSHPGLPRSS